MKRRLVLFAVLGLIWSGSATAQSVKSVVEDFGYLGRWVNSDCNQPVSRDNNSLIVSVLPSGAAEHRYDFGPGTTPEINLIFEAKRSAADEITLRYRLSNGQEREQVIVKKSGRIRTMSLRRADGTFMTKDGVILSNKMPTRSLTRCR